MRLGTKFILLTVIILSLSMSLGTLFLVDKKNDLSLQRLISKGNTLGRFIASVSPEEILAYDYITLDSYIEKISDQQDIAYGVILSTKNTNLTSHINYKNPHISKIPKQDNVIELIKKINKQTGIIPLKFPVVYNGIDLGSVLIGLSRTRLDELANQTLIESMLINAAIIIILSVCLYIVFRVEVLHSIEELIRYSKRVASGDLTSSVTVTSNDELGSLSDAFNKMTHALKMSNEEKDYVLTTLRETNKNLEDATKTNNEFLLILNAELRTPLLSILKSSDYLLNENEINKKSHPILIISRMSRHILSIMDDISELSKIESNLIKIENSTIQLEPFLNDIEWQAYTKAHEKGLIFQFNAKSKLPGNVTSDPVRIKQVLLILIEHAIKCTDFGSIQLNLECKKETGKLNFEIVDTSKGLTIDQQYKILQNDDLDNESMIERFAGSKLGLNLCTNLVKMLGGSLSIVNSPNQGSQYNVKFNSGPLSEIEFFDYTSKTNSMYNGEFGNADQLNGNPVLLPAKVLNN